MSGEQSPLYLYARLMNLIRLPDTERTQERLRQDFTAAFASRLAQGPAGAAGRCDGVDRPHLPRSVCPSMRSGCAEGVSTALGSDWQVAPHNSR